MLLTLAVLGAFLPLQAQADFAQLKEHHLLYKILKNQEHCTLAFEGHKIFLRPENIVSVGEKLFLDVDGSELALLPLVQVDETGYFIWTSLTSDLVAKQRIGGSLVSKTRGPCPECEWPTDGHGVCHNRKCPFDGVQVIRPFQ